MNGDLRSAVRVIAAMTLTAAVDMCIAQTPAQLDYERQQREYWRQQEQQRQEQQRQQQVMQENARRQQDEARRVVPGAPGSQGPAGAAAPAGPAGGFPGAGSGESPCSSFRVPDMTAEVLQGSWRLTGAVKRTSDMFSGMLQSQDALACRQSIGPEFRISGKTVHQGNASLPISHFAHQGGRYWICTSNTQFGYEVRLPEPGRLVAALGLFNAGPMCTFERASGSAPQRTANAGMPSPDSTTAGSMAPTSGSAIRMNSVYVCGGERLVVFACSGATDKDHCGVRYLDQVRQTPSGPIAAERGEDRGVLARRLQDCQPSGR